MMRTSHTRFRTISPCGRCCPSWLLNPPSSLFLRRNLTTVLLLPRSPSLVHPPSLISRHQ
eukprot:1359450-Amorphochlora_amoeboformis.AAC.1